MSYDLVSNYVIPLLTLLVGALTILGTVYIFRSVILWINTWNLGQEERLEHYINAKFDIKWPACFLGVFAIGIIIAILTSNRGLMRLEIAFSILFGLLLWGNINTLKVRRKILERIKH